MDKPKKDLIKSILILLVLSLTIGITFADDVSATLVIQEGVAILSASSISSSYQQGTAIDVYANYTLAGSPILGADCVITIETTEHILVYNPATRVYENTVLLSETGTKNYNFSCSAPGYDSKSAIGVFSVWPPTPGGGVSKISRELTDVIIETNGNFFFTTYLYRGLILPDIETSECEGKPLEDYELYKCIEAETDVNQEFINNTELMISIEKQWLLDNDLNASTVVIYKDGIPLETTYLTEDDEYVYYQCIFEGFSEFVIYAKKNVLVGIDYWTLLEKLNQYYHNKLSSLESERYLRQYYGIFEGVGTYAVHTFEVSEAVRKSRVIGALCFVVIAAILAFIFKRRLEL